MTVVGENRFSGVHVVNEEINRELGRLNINTRLWCPIKKNSIL